MANKPTYEQLEQRVKELEEEFVKRKQAEETILAERDTIINISNSMEDGLYIVNRQNDIEYVNAALSKEFGPYEGRKCYEYFHDRKEVCPWCKNDDVFSGKTVRWEWYSSKNQKTYDLIDTPLKNLDGSISKLEIFRDITKHKRAEEQIKQQIEELKEAHGKIEAQNKLLEEFSNTDALTSIANRRYFDLILKRECGWLSRAKSSLSLSLIMCDIDYFKQYNDTYGHKKGDECLQRIAGAIRSVVRRAIDCVARYGGEEFAIILPGTESDDADQLAEEVRKAVENLRIPHDNSEVDTIVTMSFGVASITNQDKESDFISILFSKADKALYMAKTSGRNKVVQSKIT